MFLGATKNPSYLLNPATPTGVKDYENRIVANVEIGPRDVAAKNPVYVPQTDNAAIIPSDGAAVEPLPQTPTQAFNLPQWTPYAIAALALVLLTSNRR